MFMAVLFTIMQEKQIKKGTECYNDDLNWSLPVLVRKEQKKKKNRILIISWYWNVKGENELLNNCSPRSQILVKYLLSLSRLCIVEKNLFYQFMANDNCVWQTHRRKKKKMFLPR